MPKRCSTAKQKAASRKNLEKARAARASTAKVTLYHLTGNKSADSIVSQGFKSRQGKVWFTNQKGSLSVRRYLWLGDRHSEVSVTLPRTKLQLDTAQPSTWKAKGEKWYTTNLKNLVGVKVRRIK